MSSWRRYAKEKPKNVFVHNQTPRSINENLRSIPSGKTVFPDSYKVSKSNVSFDVTNRSVRLIIDFVIDPIFSNVFDHKPDPIPVILETAVPLAEKEQEKGEEKGEEKAEEKEGPTIDVIDTIIEPKLHTNIQADAPVQPVVIAQPQQTTQQMIQPQYIRQPNTLVGLYNNTNTGVVTVIRSPRIARPYH